MNHNIAHKEVAAVISLAALTALSGCLGLGVRQQDLDAWVGQPVEALDTQPFFLTLPMVRTFTESGVEIRNYVNGRNLASCYGSGHVYGATYSSANYSAFSNCVAGFGACNNIFYIKDGRVLEYAPTGSGGMRCFTDSRVLPSSRRY